MSLIARLGRWGHRALDRFYLGVDKRFIRRTQNLRSIPTVEHRKGGKRSYAEWAHVIGIFQALLYAHVPQRDGVRILDVGCGNGLLALAAEPFIGRTGAYVGMDVDARALDLCRADYRNPGFQFVHLNTRNAAYAPNQGDARVLWPMANGEFDAALALSVWTHFNEADARFYMKELARVLKAGGTAIVSFFLVDDAALTQVAGRQKRTGTYHTMRADRWVFDTPAYGSTEWRYPGHLDVAEKAIGIEEAGFQSMIADAGLTEERRYPGNWKEKPGLYFQDIVVLRKVRG